MRIFPNRWLVTTLLLATSLASRADEPLDRADPARWVLWRCGMLPFPTQMFPTVPETLAAGPIIDFGRGGEDLLIVLPNGLGSDYASRALSGFARLICEKTPKAALVSAAEISDTQRQQQLLLLGTPQQNPLVQEVLGERAGEYLAGIPPGGYRVGTQPSPFRSGRRVILALGADADGAWPAAGILAYAIHPKAERLGGPVERFPVALPEGTWWAPFEARCTAPGDAVALPPEPADAPHPPRVPFGVRLWGSPMPTLESYQRLMRALKPLGINTIVVQPGGWPDLADAPQRFRTALDIAWREGVFTVFYAGNEMTAHLPAPLTASHQAIVTACDAHPGLLGWHIYNQLAAALTPAQRALAMDQTRWLRGLTHKPVGHEIVWGHNSVEIPPDKIQLIEDLKSAGMSEIASDYAPIGGWTKIPDLSRWEGRFLELRRFGLPADAVLQAHVPFLDPKIPSDLELRNQFWWALAGGARGFYFETACLYTHLSMRGLLSWDLHPLPDGRCAELPRLAETARRLETVIADSEPIREANTAIPSFAIEPATAPIALRLRRAKGGALYLLLINRSLDTAADVMVKFAAPHSECSAVELYPGQSEQSVSSTRPITAGVPVGGGACFQIITDKTR